VPELSRIDAVPAGKLAGLEQIDDSRAVGSVLVTVRIPEGLAKVAALGMRDQLEQRDDLVWV
jgi:hypothetical protein